MTILKSPECRKTFLPEFDPKEAAVLQSFKYVARDANGKIFRGVVQTESRDAAFRKLKDGGLYSL